MRTTADVMGTLNPDGTVTLDASPALPVGRVRVTLQSVGVPTMSPAEAAADFQRVMEEIWAAQKARGFVPRSAEEIDAELRDSRGWDDEPVTTFEEVQERPQRFQQVGATGDHTQADVWELFERFQAENAAGLFVPRLKEEIDAELAAARGHDEE